MIKVKTYVLPVKDATFITFEKRLPCRGIKASLVKNEIRKKWLETGNQPLQLPIIFVKPQVLESASKKLNRKPVVIEIDVTNILSFNSLKERLIKVYAS